MLSSNYDAELACSHHMPIELGRLKLTRPDERSPRSPSHTCQPERRLSAPKLLNKSMFHFIREALGSFGVMIIYKTEICFLAHDKLFSAYVNVVL
jgi:hypothetical protein